MSDRAHVDGIHLVDDHHPARPRLATVCSCFGLQQMDPLRRDETEGGAIACWLRSCSAGVESTTPLGKLRSYQHLQSGTWLRSDRWLSSLIEAPWRAPSRCLVSHQFLQSVTDQSCRSIMVSRDTNRSSLRIQFTSCIFSSWCWR